MKIISDIHYLDENEFFNFARLANRRAFVISRGIYYEFKLSLLLIGSSHSGSESAGEWV